MNYYPKIGVAEILIESSPLLEGDEMMVQGVTTGLIKQKAINLMLEDKRVLKAEKQQAITLKVNKKVRKNDQVYKIVKKV